MSLIVSNTEVLFEECAGVLRIAETRVPLDTVIYAFNEGASPEEIVFRYPTLDLSQVYAVISYYLQHREEVAEYLKKRERQRTEIKAEAESRFNPQGIRARLLARRDKNGE